MLKRSAKVSLWFWDPLHRGASLIFCDGKVTFVPGEGDNESKPASVSFPEGSWLEYRVELGDRYFDGDRSQTLGKALSVIGPDGSKAILAQAFMLFVNPSRAARNLAKIGVPLRAKRFYRDRDGHEIESEMELESSRLWSPFAVLLAISSVWLGAIAGFFVRDGMYLALIGVAGYLAAALVVINFKTSIRTGLLKALSILPSYGSGFAISVLLARYLR